MSARIGALALFGALLLAAPSAQAQESRLSGLWREVGSSPISCQGCLSIVRHGTILTVVSEAGWSAVVTVDGYGDPSYASGTARWAVGPKRAEASSEVYLALGGSQLFVVLMTKSDRARKPYFKAIYDRRTHTEDEEMGDVRKINISDK